MATYPRYDFSDPDLDYSLVEQTIKQMYADLNSQKGCCNSSKTDKTLCQIDGILQAMEIDYDANDMVRYENDVKSAYILLSPYFNIA